MDGSMELEQLDDLVRATRTQLQDPEARRAAIRAAVDFLLSEPGRDLIEAQLHACSLGGTPTVQAWATELTNAPGGQDELAREKFANLLEAIVGRPDVVDMGDEEVDVQAVAKAIAKVAAGWAAKGGGVPQWLEAIDDAFGIENLVADGAVAALVTLALSSAMNSRRYHLGDIRWDDALDSVAGDVIKATITGVIVSAAVGGISSVAGPAGLVAVVPIALVVYAAVSAICDSIYERLLGGREIVAARRMHGEYVELSQHIRDELYPRVERARALGSLVEFLGDAASGQLTDDLVDEAARLFDSLASRERLLAWTPRAEEVDWLQQVLAKEKLRTPWAPAEVERIAGDVHRIYWRIEPHLPRVKIPVESIAAHLDWPDEPDDRRKDRRRLVEFLVGMERRRPGADGALTFEIKTRHSTEHNKTLPTRLRATDVVELARFVQTAVRAPWGPNLAKPEKISVRTAKVKKPRPIDEKLRKLLSNAKGTSAQNWKSAEDEVIADYDSWHRPLEYDIANPLYRAGFMREVMAGGWRLFRMNISRGPTPKFGYVAIPIGGDEAVMRRSLAEDHPFFRDQGRALATLEEVEWSEQVAGDGGVFVAMGWRCAPMELYTATYRFQDEDGGIRQLSQEGYFTSLYEAYCGFAVKLDRHHLIGVRPGGLVLSDPLRQRLAAAGREEFWSLQQALIDRISQGMFLLDELANHEERRLALLAGGGVLISAWWFLSTRSRRELLGVLHNARVRQTLRYELMEALLELQRVHSLSHGLFDGDDAAARQGRLREVAAAGVQRNRGLEPRADDAT